MKISDALSQAFDNQITLELQAAVVYRQLAIEMNVRDLPGMATWFAAQSAEELEHADKFAGHVVDRGNHPRIGDISAPALSIESPLAAFRAALAHEQKVSAAIRALFRQARDEDDIDSVPLLHWFLDEQVEEEATVGEIVGRLELVKDDGPGLLRLDTELSIRTAAE
ncbi:ferritin [Georgenia sunbinii]|uniref:ferritin n=1 Tax=Georgenia sunbinii TaxID=3117728 RepID=UPI002F267992